MSETKTDYYLLTVQFHTEGYTAPYRDIHDGSMLLYIKEDIPSSLLNSDVSREGFFVELNLRKVAVMLFL